MSKAVSASTAPNTILWMLLARQQHQPWALFLLTVLCILFPPLSHAQRIGKGISSDRDVSALASESANTLLPDASTAPDSGKVASCSGYGVMPKSEVGRKASVSSPKTSSRPTDKYVAPGQAAPKQTVVDKIFLGVEDAGSAKTVFAAALAAGISHANDSSPNFGRNSTAYAQRFGAGMARGGSYSIFSDSVMASVLHEDPRYYRLGKSHRIVKRMAYAVTRPLISRTDSGSLTPNFSLFAGHLGGAYLTKLYYPPQNTSSSEVFETFGFSLMGSAIDDGVNEFLSGALNFIHNSRPTKD